MTKLRSIFLSLLLFSNITYCENISNPLVHVLKNFPEDIALFIDNVLRQVPSVSFINLATKIIHKKTNIDDQLLYRILLQHVSSITSRFSAIKKINLIRFQKKTLGNQINQLIPEHRTFNHCLEIGTPGTYLSTIRKRIFGTIYVANYAEKVTDIVQAHSLTKKNFRGYDVFVPLNDYEPLSEDIKDNSLDLVICFIGLHHIPKEKLHDFVVSIKRVLRPGGIFLLRDHNAHNEKLIALASAAHSIFNLIIPQEPLNVEQAEVRNFQSLSYWISLLEEHGFFVSHERLLQEGDSTLNTMIKCVKKSESSKDFIEEAHMESLDNPIYNRDISQTFLTLPEWNNVDSAQEYGAFIEHTPFYKFPYIKSVGIYWKIFFNSLKGASKKKSLLSLIFSPYTLMNTFIGSVMTVEYVLKSLISMPIRAMYADTEEEKILLLVRDNNNELEDYVEVKKVFNDGIKLIAVPRYKTFTQFVRMTSLKNIQFLKIAGNDSIICRIKREKNNKNLQQKWHEEFSWDIPTNQKYVYAAYTIPVISLHEFMQDINDQRIEFIHIHDF